MTSVRVVGARLDSPTFKRDEVLLVPECDLWQRAYSPLHFKVGSASEAPTMLSAFILCRKHAAADASRHNMENACAQEPNTRSEVQIAAKTKWGLAVAAMVVVALIVAVSWRYYDLRAKERATKANAHKIQLALERIVVDIEMQYGTDLAGLSTAHLRHDFASLLSTGHLEEIPRNPFNDAPVRLIAFGNRPVTGDICLLPAKYHYAYQNQRVDADLAYHLLVFGVRRARGCRSRGILRSDLFIDMDSNGYADPVLAHLQAGNTKGLVGAEPEPLEDTLARLGYVRPLDEPLPDDWLGFLRWFIGL